MVEDDGEVLKESELILGMNKQIIWMIWRELGMILTGGRLSLKSGRLLRTCSCHGNDIVSVTMISRNNHTISRSS